MRINLTTPMSDDKERQQRNETVLDAIERYTEGRMATDYVCEHTDGSRSGGQPVLKPCPFCGSLPKSGDSTYGYWLIFCSDENNCLAQPSVELKTEAEAIAAWNKRQPTQSDAEIAEADCNAVEYIAGDRARDLDYQLVAYHREWSVLEERAKIVAWLRDGFVRDWGKLWRDQLTNAIEVGEHLK